MLKKLQLIKSVKFTVSTKKTTITTNTDHSTAIHEEHEWYTNVPLTQDDIDILKLGLSFTPTPRQNIAELEHED